MKRKMLGIMIGILIFIVLILVGWYVMSRYLGVGPAFPFARVDAVEYLRESGEISKEQPLMALTDSEESAREIAEQYGITFLSFEEGIAFYDTEEELAQVVRRGEENGYPAVYINYARELYEE